MASKTYYDVLGVAPDADAIVIRAAYRALMLKFHPDINADAPDIARDISEAFQTLGRPESRAAYDRKLGIQPAPRGKPQSGGQSGPGPQPFPQGPARPRPYHYAGNRGSGRNPVARVNGWLLPTTALLVAATSLGATYSFVQGPALAMSGNELADTGEEGVSNLITVAANEAQPEKGLSLFKSGRSPRAQTVPAAGPEIAAGEAGGVDPSAVDTGIALPSESDAAAEGQLAAAGPAPEIRADDLLSADLLAAEPLMAQDIVRAVAKFNEVRAEGGKAALRAFSAKCDLWAHQLNTLQARDYCVAFDYAGRNQRKMRARRWKKWTPYRMRMAARRSRASGAAEEVNADPMGSRFAMIKRMVERETTPSNPSGS